MRDTLDHSLKQQHRKTLQYYERNAQEYFNATRGVDLSEIYDRFTRLLLKRVCILDAGSGSGRDTLAFKERGFSVSAVDPSPSLCQLSTKLTGIPTRVCSFQELEAEEEYDGIWACAALLHVPMDQLPHAIMRLAHALRPGGVLYMSFKYGRGERVSADGRFFVDMTETRMKQLIRAAPELSVEELWITHGEGKFKGVDDWLNTLAIKRTSGSREEF